MWTFSKHSWRVLSLHGSPFSLSCHEIYHVFTNKQFMPFCLGKDSQGTSCLRWEQALCLGWVTGIPSPGEASSHSRLTGAQPAWRFLSNSNTASHSLRICVYSLCSALSCVYSLWLLVHQVTKSREQSLLLHRSLRYGLFDSFFIFSCTFFFGISWGGVLSVNTVCGLAPEDHGLLDIYKDLETRQAGCVSHWRVSLNAWKI